MSHRYRLALIAASIATLAPLRVRAQKDVASCKTVLDAVAKQRTVPYHSYNTFPMGATAKPAKTELISIGGQHYILLDVAGATGSGKWSKSPMDQAALAKQEEENIRDATALSCHRIREESVGGVPAVVWAEHSENADTKTDGQVWVASATGLVMRTEADMTMTDGSGTNHLSSRFEYTDVHAPEVK